ncbi:hypothetical protein [Reyranella sp.]|uniref:hypothetical protein n=1 Tax=Reyranella sp. TaxID=1929291 RepID=UPI00271A70AF|nr:hypothetical protein [Reyranella sp.]MDO8974337.1 hypothetical protein [Reyranella sp.]
MKAKVIKAFMGAPDGALHPRQFEVSELVEGDLARVAVAEGWAEALGAAPMAQEPLRRRSASR